MDPEDTDTEEAPLLEPPAATVRRLARTAGLYVLGAVALVVLVQLVLITIDDVTTANRLASTPAPTVVGGNPQYVDIVVDGRKRWR